MDRPLVDMVELVGRFFELARECEVTRHTRHIVTTQPEGRQLFPLYYYTVENLCHAHSALKT